MIDSMVENNMVRPELDFKTATKLELVVDTRKRDALENALSTLDSLADDLDFDAAAGVVYQINEAYRATEKALSEMEAM